MDAPRATSARPWSTQGHVVRLGAFTLAYYALARVGLLFAESDSLASPIWPPTGLALAFGVLWGWRVLPGVFLGAFAVEFTGTDSGLLALAMAGGNTAEAWLGSWLVRRAGGIAAFDSSPGVVRFAGATLVAPLLAATVGATGLVLAGHEAASSFGWIWFTWYLGDAAGGFVVAPVLLLAARLVHSRGRPWHDPRAPEAAALTGTSLLVAVIALGLLPGLPALPTAALLVVPAIAWAAYRLGPTSAAGMVLGADLLAVLVRRSEAGPFEAADPTASLLVLQAFMFTLGLMALGLAAQAAERRRDAGLLAQRVAERTRELEEALRRLGREQEERSFAQKQLHEAQQLSGIGTWRWDITKPHAEWSPELFGIYGLDPAKHVPSYDDYLTRVHPDDVERVKAATEAVFRDHKSYSHDERIRRPDGQWRHLHTWARAVLDDTGKLVALIGACQDITDRIAEEGKFRSLLESAPDAMVIVGPDGRIALINGQAERMFGYTRDELLGKSIDLLVPDALRGSHAAHRADYGADPRPRPMGAGLDLRARRKDGSEVPVEISLSPLQTSEGLLISSAIRDITERKKAEQALGESLERFRALADASPIGIVHTRADGVVDYVNERWRQITGVLDHTDRERMRKAVHPDDQPKAAEQWLRCIREGREFDAEMRFVHPDGAVRLTQARAVPVRDRHGAITGFVSALADITDQRAAEAKDREVRRLSEQAEFKTNFLRTAAHELGTPLTPIKIQMRILRDLLDTHDDGRVEEERKATDILDRNIGRLSVLVRDMLESARLQSGRLRLAVRPMDMAQAVHEVVETFQGPAIQGGISLDTQGPGLLPMHGDPDRLSQVLYNLLSNAMKFTPPGGSIHVRWAREGPGKVRVTVQDTGAGFTAEQAAQLFQPFVQLHQPSGEKPRGGSGLGLYISKGIVEQHGGRLTADSGGPGQGATFSFVLPAGAQPATAEPERSLAQPPRAK